MTTLLLAALAAGMVSVVNPCGFAMLPAYLGYFLRDDGHAGRAGTVAASVAAGFLAVFTMAGVLMGIGVRAVVGAIPWLALVVGIGLIIFGVSQLLGRRLIPYLRGAGRVEKSGSVRGMFLFGVSYAVASLSCTLPIFLSLTTGAIASGSAAQAVLTFVVYGAGMGLMVVGVTVALAMGRTNLVDRIRPLAARLDHISGWILVGSGGFIVWYWATILSDGAAALGGLSIVRLVDEWSSTVTRLVADRPFLIAVIVALVVVWRWRRHTVDRLRTENREIEQQPGMLETERS